MIKMLKGENHHIDKEQGKTKHEAPCSVNYRATQNKNTKFFHSSVNVSDWNIYLIWIAFHIITQMLRAEG